MSKLEKILIDTLFINNYDVVWGHDDAKQQIKELILELMENCDDWIGDSDGEEIRIFDETEFKRRIEEL